MNSSIIIFDNIRMSLDLPKRCPICFSQSVEDWLKRPSLPAIAQKKDILTGNQVPVESSSSYRRSSATYHIAHSEPLPYPNPLFRKAFHPFNPLYLIIHLYLKTQRCTPRGCLVPIASVSTSRKQSFYSFLEVWIVVFIFCFMQGRLYCYRKHDVFITLRSKLWGFALDYETSRERIQSRYCPSRLASRTDWTIVGMWRWNCSRSSIFVECYCWGRLRGVHC